MRRPPVTMATQHPDNAGTPWWKADPFVSTPEEIDELLVLFRELPIDEYMWDWEGKYVDESVGEKIYSRAREFFQERPLGDDLHLTFRIPAFDGDSLHRMARAFMNVLSLADLGRELDVEMPPVTEMFLPLTTSADQPLQVRKAFREVMEYHRAVFRRSADEDHELRAVFEVTPLIEDVPSMFALASIVRPYWETLKRERPMLASQRLFLARSDPAMNAGLVPAVLAVKAALSVAEEVGAELGLAVHPILGTGSLPFRGGVQPGRLDALIPQYAGVRTYSIQSAFRYDWPLAEVRSALEQMQCEVPGTVVRRLRPREIEMLRVICEECSSIWQSTIEPIADVINAAAAFIPPRRERRQHIGLFGYSRGIGAVKLPRAIGFTAALYSLGIPPELIATGRGLRHAARSGNLELIREMYPMLEDDLREAGAYFNRENLRLLQKRYPAFAAVGEDIGALEELLKIELGPRDPRHMIHRNLTSSIFHRLHGEQDTDALRRDVAEAAVIRRSIG